MASGQANPSPPSVNPSSPGVLDSLIVLLASTGLAIFLLWAASRTQGGASFEHLPDWLRSTYGAVWGLILSGTGVGLAIAKAFRRKGQSTFNFLYAILGTTIVLLVLIVLLTYLFKPSVIAPTQTTEAPKSSQPTPDMEPRINAESLGPVNKGKDTIVLAIGEMANKGAQSGTVSRLWLQLIVDGKTFEGEAVADPKPTDRINLLNSPSKGHTATLFGKDYWTYKVLRNDLQPSHSVPIWVAATFRGVRKDDAIKDKATIVLNCEDANGRITSTNRTLTGKGNDLQTFQDLAKSQ
jgi:hypothetical protein